jgi:hypothetical protein
MSWYQILEDVAELRVQELRREAEKAALVAEARRASGPGYRTRMARRLREWAWRLDPAGEPAFAA